jgi:hypothetical protein
MEGKAYVVANISEEDSSINKVGVHNFRYLVKKPPFYIFVKIMDNISHYFLIYGGSGPSVMSKIIMEELGLSCTNKNVTLVLCAHPEIRTTLNIQVIDMHVSNYSIILGRYWKALTGGYLSLDGTHLSISQNGKNIIFLREGRISP